MKKTNRVGRTNLEMNDKTYALRRMVMGLVYEAKKLYPEMPRIEVRIVEKVGNVLGTANLNAKTKHISIMHDTVTDNYDVLRHVVFHELVHTVFNARHDESCPLMKAYVSIPCTKSEVHAIYKKYAKGA